MTQVRITRALLLRSARCGMHPRRRLLQHLPLEPSLTRGSPAPLFRQKADRKESIRAEGQTRNRRGGGFELVEADLLPAEKLPDAKCDLMVVFLAVIDANFVSREYSAHGRRQRKLFGSDPLPRI